MLEIAIIEHDIQQAGKKLMALNEIKDCCCRRIFTSIDEFLSEAMEVDIILFDLKLEDWKRGIVKIIKKIHRCKVVAFSQKEDFKEVVEALSIGVLGYAQTDCILYSAETLIKQVVQEGAYLSSGMIKEFIRHFNRASPVLNQLTPREIEITGLIKSGSSYKEIAKSCSITIDTVRMHIRNIYRKLNIKSKMQLVNLLSTDVVTS